MAYSRLILLCHLLPQVAQAAYGDTYDCGAGYARWRDGWSVHKKDWCCHHQGLGCPDVHYPDYYPSFQDSRYEDNQPDRYRPVYHSDRRRSATVIDAHRYPAYDTSVVHVHHSSERRSGNDLPYDCQAGYARWQDGWSFEKKDWCCHQQGLACPNVHYPVTYPGAFPPAYQDAYPDDYQHHVHVHHVHTYAGNNEPYDCAAGLSNWQDGWSVSKKSWCCDHYPARCQVATRRDYYQPPADNVHVYHTAHRGSYVTYHHHRNDPYDCEEGYGNWQDVWPAAKKAWCCDNFRRGCDRHAGRYRHTSGRTYYNKAEEVDGESILPQTSGSLHGAPMVAAGGVVSALFVFAVLRFRRAGQATDSEELLAVE